jgi:hypothetical protein
MRGSGNPQTCVWSRLSWRNEQAPVFRILKNDAAYYNGVRTHRSLNKDPPVSRLAQRSGVISSHAILGGLHHHYVRI